MAEALIELVVFGSSGHARVVLDAIEKSGGFIVVGLLTPDFSVGETKFGYPVLGDDDQIAALVQERPGLVAITAIGENKIRAHCVELAQKRAPELRFATAIHPAASIGRDVSIGEGTFVAGGATINPGTHIGRHVIINTNASVDHDCRVGDFAHIAPNAALAGDVVLGDRSMVGLGAGVIEGRRLGSDVLVAAGGMAITDLSNGIRVAGVPAKRII